MKFEGTFKDNKDCVSIKCGSTERYYDKIKLISNKRMRIENRCIEFMNKKTFVMNYLYILETKCECCLIDKRLTYIYHPVRYFYSRTLIGKEQINNISEVIVVSQDIAVETNMLSDRMSKYNRRLIMRAIAILEKQDVCTENIIPIKMNIVKHVKEDQYSSISGQQIKIASDTSYLDIIKCYNAYVKLNDVSDKNSLYYMCKAINGKYFYVDNSLILNINSSKNLFNLSSFSYEQILKNKQPVISFLDSDMNSLNVANIANEYQFITKYSTIINYLLTSYNVTNDLCINKDIRNEVNCLMKEYRRGNWRNWEFDLDKAKNSQLLSLVLLQYKTGLLGNADLPKFTNCVCNQLSYSNLIVIAERLTELRNTYCHGGKVKIKCYNALWELLNEIYYLVICKQLGLGVMSLNFEKLYSNLALDGKYSDEVAMYKKLDC